MIDVAAIQRMFLAYRQTDADVIEACLARARLMVDVTVWGAKADAGIALLTAHYLALDSAGTTTELQADKTTTYKVQFDELRGSLGASMLVAGGGCGFGGSGWSGGWQ